MLSRNLENVPPRKAHIMKIRMITLPTMGVTGGCEPHFRIICGDTEHFTKQDVRPPVLRSSDSIYELKLPKPVEVSEDVLVECFNKSLVGNGEKIFQFWFNVAFVNEDGVLRIHKGMLDKAYRDKSNKKFNKNFRVEVEMAFDDFGGGTPESSLEPDMITRILKLSENMPLNYRKLPLF
ncbi:MAG: hypothetical protein P4M11_13825 [Candidatus Pacebacteria bacterium]|nr:hypothetical protein [Candidatus Paceibacterota bacterium]